MKSVLLLLIVSLAFPLHAKIGESVEELEQRYGKALEVRSRPDDMEDRRYRSDDYVFRVTLRDGKSVQEIVSPRSGTLIFTDDECLELAEKVTGLRPGDWTKADGSNNLRRRWDAKGFAMTFGHPNLTITADAYLESRPKTRAVLGSADAAESNFPMHSITFTNLDGLVITNARVVRVELDGLLYAYSEGLGGGKVKFENLPEPVQNAFAETLAKLRKAAADRANQKLADDALREAREDSTRYHAIAAHADLVDWINESDFPKTEKSVAACKEILGNLKAIDKVIDVGVAYSRFGSILTDTAYEIEKLKTRRSDDLPPKFVRHVDLCIEHLKSSKEFWAKKIENRSHALDDFYEFYLQYAWDKAGLELEYCEGIAGKSRIVNDLAIIRIASIIRREQKAALLETVPSNSHLDRRISRMSFDELVEELKRSIKPTAPKPDP